MDADQATPSEGRKLASIVSIDIAGYSRLAETDEAAAIAAVNAVRARIDSAVAAYSGRVFSTAGDGFMLEFPTASGALMAAEAIVAGDGPTVRAGVHVGEVSATSGGDMLGHGVNIAARIQHLAPPGAVLASGDVKRSVRGDLGARLIARGAAKLDKMEETLPLFQLGATPATARAPVRIDWRWGAAGATVLAMLTGAAFLALNFLHPARPTRIAVLPFRALGDAPAAGAFSDTLSDRIVTALSSRNFLTVSPDDAAALRGADAEHRRNQLGVGLVLDGTIQGADPINVAARLEDPRSHNILWSAQIQDAAANAANLQARVAARITAEMYCGARALRPVGGLSDPAALAAYLKACDLFLVHSDDSQSVYQLLAALRQVTALAPQFSAAHSDIAKYEAYFIDQFPDDQVTGVRRDALNEAQRALALDPHNADAYVAQYLLLPNGQWTQGERMLRQGLAIDADWPHANGFLGNLLTEVGRTQDAAVYYQRAAAANPLSGGLSWSGQNAIGLANIGRLDLADRAVADIRRLWANDDADGWRVRFDVALAERRWEAGLDLMNERAAMPEWISPSILAQYRAFLEAGKAGTRQRLESERRDLIGLAAQAHGSFPLRALAALGFTDDVFTILQHRSDADLSASSITYFLFTPTFAGVRRDPRFMRLAARLGLIAYWRAAGVQPDFCSEPNLPYNCAAEEQRAQPR